MGKAGRFGAPRNNAGIQGPKSAMYLRGFRKAKKRVPNTIKNGEVVITKPADPEKVKAWRESDEYKELQQNQQRRRRYLLKNY